MLNWTMEVVDRLTPTIVKRLAKSYLPGIDQNIYSFVRHATPSKLRVVRIRSGPLKGRLFECSLKNERDYWLGIYEPAISYFLSTYLVRGDIFYDIGIHKGYFALVAATVVGPTGLVVGFEPNPGNREAFARNLALNDDVSRQICLMPYAIAESRRTVHFVGGPSSTMGRVVRDEGCVVSYKVEATSLDDLIDGGLRPPRLIKMDIEGGERWALSGMARCLERNRPTLLVEIHNAESYEKLFEIAGQAEYDVYSSNGTLLNSDTAFRVREQYVACPAGGVAQALLGNSVKAYPR